MFKYMLIFALLAGLTAGCANKTSSGCPGGRSTCDGLCCASDEMCVSSDSYPDGRCAPICRYESTCEGTSWPCCASVTGRPERVCSPASFCEGVPPPPDPCGGCPDGYACTTDGDCVRSPGCGERGDGCGGSYGSCCSGFLCVQTDRFTTAGECAPTCSSDLDCAGTTWPCCAGVEGSSARVCSPASYCDSAPPPPSCTPTNDPCTASSECCAWQDGYGYCVEGYCAETCTRDADCASNCCVPLRDNPDSVCSAPAYCGG